MVASQGTKVYSPGFPPYPRVLPSEQRGSFYYTRGISITPGYDNTLRRRFFANCTLVIMQFIAYGTPLTWQISSP
jgi:hypothetical protein